MTRGVGLSAAEIRLAAGIGNAGHRALETPASRKAQSSRFVAAREAGCSEDEADFDANLKRIVSARAVAAPDAPPRNPNVAS